MPLDKSKFSGNVGAGSDAPSLYVYKTIDTKAATIASGYFNELADILEIGDIILATTDTGTTPKAYFLSVLTNSGTVVTTAFGGVA